MEQFDLFGQQKVSRAYKNSGTQIGAVLTIVTWIFAVLLIGGELFHWAFSVSQDYEFLVNTLEQLQNTDQQLQMHMDLIVHTRCEYLSLDVVDSSGASQHMQADQFEMTGVHYETFTARRNKHQETLNIRQLISGAKVQKRQKRQVVWFIFRQEDQEPEDLEHDSCRITGRVGLNKVAGNVHITTKGHGYGGFVHTPHEQMNFTHSINELQFGEKFPGIINPLDGITQQAQEHFATFSYLINVVPTIYQDGWRQLDTNQYAYTQHSHQWSEEGLSKQVPGIFIKYDIEPLTVRVTEQRTSFLTLITRVGAVLGGVTYLAGFFIWIVNYRSVIVMGRGRNV